MTEIIIQEMSQVVISDDLLRQIDMDGLIKKFRENHARLDDFKRTRDAYEDKPWYSSSKLNPFDNTLKNAQLDAIEVQAEFSKSIGQLTVVNIALSKRLNEQQQQLAEQQNIIKKQTNTIEGQTYELERQHVALAKQNEELDKLVKDYFELKGLTQEGAKKLIEIAKEIEKTRDVLLESVSTTVQNLQDRVSGQQQEMATKMDTLENSMNEVQGNILKTIEESQSSIAKQQEKTIDEISLKIKLSDEATRSTKDELTKSVSTTVQNLQDRVSGQQQEMATKMDTLENSMNEVQGNILKTIEESQSSIAKQQEKTIDEISLKIKLSDEATQKIEQDFKNYREQEYKKIKNLTIIFSATSAILCSLVGYLLII